MEATTKKTIIYIVLGAFALWLILWTAFGPMESPFSWQGLGLWVAAFLSLSILSFLYDDNPFYKVAESLFIGVSAAYYIVYSTWNALVNYLLVKLWPSAAKNLIPELEIKEIHIGEWLWYFLALVMGIMLVWRLAPKGGWISRWPLAVLVGWAAGMNLTRYLVSDFTKQVQTTLIPLVVLQPDGGSIAWYETLSNITLVGGVLCGLIYFFFSVEHKGVFGKASRLGIWIIMITFGAAFGYTVMGRVALLVGRMEFLFVDWMRIVAQ
ncbi:MAG: hypothetical protein JW797_15595 [Bradymonadales bacterium]|nr:hypothetical protein [Bradymonadales bacterium]